MSTPTGTPADPPSDMAQRAVIEATGLGTPGPGPAGVAVQNADFAEFTAPAPAIPAASLDNLLDVSVVVSAELGRTTTTIGEILKLGIGSVVPPDPPPSEPVDLMAQGVRLA